VSSETTSLSYDEIAAIFGIERESARQLTLRKRWNRVKGNDGKARVEVPNDALPSNLADSTGQDTGAVPSDDTGEEENLARVLTRHIERLEQALDETHQRTKIIETARDLARAEAREAERDRDVAREAERTIRLELAGLAAAIEAEKARTGFERNRANELKAERDRWADQASRSWWKRLVG
jgi:hypothetical protein